MSIFEEVLVLMAFQRYKRFESSCFFNFFINHMLVFFIQLVFHKLLKFQLCILEWFGDIQVHREEILFC